VIEIGDAALVAAALAGDRTAEDRLVIRHAPAMIAITARLLGSSHDAEDVVQDAMISAFGQLSRLRDPAAFRAWIVRIAVLRARQLLRRRRIARALGIDTVVPDATLEASAAPDAPADVRAELALLDRVLSSLPAEQRIAWMLRHVEGLELTDVADACGCSLATVKRWIASADARVSQHVRVAAPGEERA
jgi:RNA polymerase sigma-70 factor (ECF subfamily)